MNQVRKFGAERRISDEVRFYRPSPGADHVWRIGGRGKPEDFHAEVDGKDCYWFQRAPSDDNPAMTWLVPVETFWGAK